MQLGISICTNVIVVFKQHFPKTTPTRKGHTDKSVKIRLLVFFQRVMFTVVTSKSLGNRGGQGSK